LSSWLTTPATMLCYQHRPSFENAMNKSSNHRNSQRLSLACERFWLTQICWTLKQTHFFKCRIAEALLRYFHGLKQRLTVIIGCHSLAVSQQYSRSCQP
jgi:hypothetical protein